MIRRRGQEQAVYLQVANRVSGATLLEAVRHCDECVVQPGVPVSPELSSGSVLVSMEGLTAKLESLGITAAEAEDMAQDMCSDKEESIDYKGFLAGVLDAYDAILV